jgi:hypothetical protein
MLLDRPVADRHARLRSLKPVREDSAAREERPTASQLNSGVSSEAERGPLLGRLS